MQGCSPRIFAVSLLLICAATHIAKAEIPSSWIDDAQLNDVQLIGSKYAFAVGEHGTIWKSDDGGRKWNLLNCGFDISLRSVCFLTDQDGWIAGGDAVPYSTSNPGILLTTSDGGKTWKRLGKDQLPTLSHVRFFDLDEGVVVGKPSPLSSTGIFKTNDSGKTWHGVAGNIQQAWKAACFTQVEIGVVAGANGRVSMMGGEQLFESNLPARGLRSVRSIALTSDEVGWLAGDGGLLLKTTKNGVVWEAPQTSLPDELREGMDFRSVDVRGEKVWLAGSPGSVIWHSPDGGKSWSKQLTGQTAPLSAVRFSNDQRGLAVGAFGVIVRTEDGGKNWRAVRGDGRRAALLSFHSRLSQTGAPLLSKLSGESGYRSAVWIAQRSDFGPLSTSTDGEDRLQAAVQKCGGNAAEIHWQLPLTVPGLERSSTKLAAEWQKQTEGRLSETLHGGLVRQIRTWRPNVIVIDQPSPDDAACQLLYDAILRAVEQSADTSRYAKQAELTGLSPWKVDRIYMRLAAGAAGDTTVELDEFLPYLKVSNRIAASSSIALLQPNRILQRDAVDSPNIAYRLLSTNGQRGDDSGPSTRKGSLSASISRDFFTGLSITPGSAARRETGKLDEANLERLQKIAQKHRNFTSIAQKSLDDPRMAHQMLGQLNVMLDGMDSRQAATLLRDLADEHRKRSQFELVESTYSELVKRYPNEPESIDAMRWLIQFWCSSETAWQRTRAMTSKSAIQLTRADQPAQYLQQSVGDTLLADDGVRQAVLPDDAPTTSINTNSSSPVRLNAKLDFDDKAPGNKNSSKSGRLKIDQDVDWRTGAVSEWHARANELTKKLEVISPTLYRSAEIQFPLAGVKRGRGAPRAADAIMRTFQAGSLEPDMRQLVERELWSSFETVETPSAYGTCRRAASRPHLDGLLSDACWEAADEILLSSQVEAGEQNNSPKSMVMFSYDNEFLYLAISVVRAEGALREPVQQKGRKHDADLNPHDRLTFRLDLDRDYATWYEFQFDQRGWTAESCWEDWRWNPQYFVAAESDQNDWRIEAAIPWNELMPNAPQRGTFYSVSILRTIPAVGLQSWAQPATMAPRPTAFGLLKLD